MFSNIFIAVCAVCFLWQGYILSGNRILVDTLSIFTFFATLFTYLFIRIAAKKRISEYKPAERWHFFLNHYASYKVLAAISFSICAVLYFTLSKQVQFAILIPGIVSVCYGIPLFKYRQKVFRIRDIGISKIFQIAFVWAYIGSVMPAVNATGNGLTQTTYLLFAANFFFIFGMYLPFDIRDMEVDRNNNVKTIPMLVGITKTKIISYTSLIISLVIYGACEVKTHSGPIQTSIAIAIIIALAIVAVQHSSTKKKEYYFLGIIDGIIILEFLLVLIFSRMRL